MSSGGGALPEQTGDGHQVGVALVERAAHPVGQGVGALTLVVGDLLRYDGGGAGPVEQEQHGAGPDEQQDAADREQGAGADSAPAAAAPRRRRRASAASSASDRSPSSWRRSRSSASPIRAASPRRGARTGRVRSPRVSRRLSRKSRSSGRWTVPSRTPTASAPISSSAPAASSPNSGSVTGSGPRRRPPWRRRSVRGEVATVPLPGSGPVRAA